MGLIKKDFLINSKELRNVIAPYSQILKICLKRRANSVTLQKSV